MPSAHRLKKNSTIEVRLPDETKAAFMERCQLEGRTASEAVRSFIEVELREPSGQKRRSPLRLGLATLAGVAMGAGMAAPSFASSATPTEAGFEKLDQDRDGRLTFQEYSSR